MKRINLWSSPRNVSTALMYAFAQRPDTTVVDEPLYAYYLRHTPSLAGHPGAEEVLRSQSDDGEQVVREVILGHQYNQPVVVFKQMTHHLLSLDRQFLGLTDNVLLIRDPRAILASYTKVIDNPSPEDIGIPQQFALWQELQQQGKLSAVVDARELLLSPARVLAQLCERLNLVFTEAMLSWPPGPRPEDGVWAKYWYHNVHQSSGFQPYEQKNYELPAHLSAVADQCKEPYELLLAQSIRHNG